MTGARKDPRDMDAAELTAELNEARHEHSAATNRLNHAEAVWREKLRNGRVDDSLTPWSPAREVEVVK